MCTSTALYCCVRGQKQNSLDTDRKKICFQIDLIKPLSALYPEECLLTDEHFVHDDTQRPPVTQLVVARLQEDFRGNVVRCSHSRVRLKVTER